jgi:hypothetical protein
MRRIPETYVPSASGSRKVLDVLFDKIGTFYSFPGNLPTPLNLTTSPLT